MPPFLLNADRERMALPQGRQGTAEIEPAGLADMILSWPFTVTLEDSQSKQKALEELYRLPPLREPLWHSFRRWTGAKMLESVGANIQNVESALIQIVGTQPSKPCNACLVEIGPWGKCVFFRGSTIDITLACANCRWAGNDERCDYSNKENMDAQKISSNAQKKQGPSLQNIRRRYKEILRGDIEDLREIMDFMVNQKNVTDNPKALIDDCVEKLHNLAKRMSNDELAEKLME